LPLRMSLRTPRETLVSSSPPFYQKKLIEWNKDHPSFAPLYFPNELHRHEALAQDLEYFYGEDWQNQISCSSAAQHYVDRIHEVGQTDPVLLVAHAYTRYMGDLSGGQVLKKVAQRALRLPPTGEGVKFYEFDSIHSAKAFKQLYRSRMNELELDAQTKEKLVQEAVLAFQFNMEVFDELEEIGKTIQDDVMDAGPIHGDMQGDISKCPYYAAKTGKPILTEFHIHLAQNFSLLNIPQPTVSDIKTLWKRLGTTATHFVSIAHRETNFK
uniref:heme oxygenase (biliverdin-producing) n=1 Tax=Astyanax mexicanus TaxID=7994 RepID=A0A8B9KHM1_ASTMX